MKRLELTDKVRGQIKLQCPVCKDERSDKKDKSLSCNLDSGLYRCHYCGASGIFDEYRKTSQVEEFSLPKLNTTGLGDEQLAYLLGRGISGTTINRNKITMSPKGWLEFNYFEQGKLVNIKYRSIHDKKFMQHKGGKPILYGIDDIILAPTIVITEGEIDKLSVEEAGFISCVSVPMGAPNEKDTNVEGKLKCFSYAEDYFEDCKDIVIAVDNDRNGNRLKDELARRFGKHRCRWVDFGEYKDANEVLVAEGKDFLTALIREAKSFPIEGVAYVGDFLKEIHDLYVNGAPDCYSVGLGWEFDALYKIAPGFLTVVTGSPTSGKSCFVENVCYNLMKQYGWRVASFSPEHPEALGFQRYARMMTGKYFFEGPIQRMSTTDLSRAVEFFQEHLYYVKHKMNNSIDTILSTFRQLVFKHGIKAAIIDPWTDVEHHLAGRNETLYTAAALAQIKDFAREYGVHVFLIAHPTKPRKDSDGGYVKPSLYDISGSANFYNKADGGIIVHRATDYVEVDVKKVKFEGIHGKQGTAFFHYDITSCTYQSTMKPSTEDMIDVEF